jgi:hypothetical protein
LANRPQLAGRLEILYVIILFGAGRAAGVSSYSTVQCRGKDGFIHSMTSLGIGFSRAKPPSPQSSDIFLFFAVRLCRDYSALTAGTAALTLW